MDWVTPLLKAAGKVLAVFFFWRKIENDKDEIREKAAGRVKIDKDVADMSTDELIDELCESSRKRL